MDDFHDIMQSGMQAVYGSMWLDDFHQRDINCWHDWRACARNGKSTIAQDQTNLSEGINGRENQKPKKTFSENKSYTQIDLDLDVVLSLPVRPLARCQSNRRLCHRCDRRHTAS